LAAQTEDGNAQEPYNHQYRESDFFATLSAPALADCRRRLHLEPDDEKLQK
jgi:hypothetical protein